MDAGIRYDRATGSWRGAVAKSPTPAQRRVLRALAAGDELTADPVGVVKLRNANSAVQPRTLKPLVANGRVTAPASTAPLFGWAEVPGEITELGRNELLRSSSK